MSICFRIQVILLGLLAFSSSDSLFAQEITLAGSGNDVSEAVVGTVMRSDGRGHYMIRERKPFGPNPFEIFQGGDLQPDVKLNDVFMVPDAGNITLNLPSVHTVIEITRGKVEITGTPDDIVCEVHGADVHFIEPGKKEMEELGIKSCCSESNGKSICPNGTEYMVQARGYETSVFVVEGEVSIVDELSGEPTERTVRAGEWVNFRKGEVTPPPQRYRLSDARSGSSDCIYSNCKITDLVPPFGPWFPPPEILAPPPFNPPGRK